MTGDYTSLKVSQRLAEAMRPDDEHGLWWIQIGKGEPWALAKMAAYEIHAEYGDVVGCVAAYTLADLEAETRRMGLIAKIQVTKDDARCQFFDTIGVCGEDLAEHLIDAWGAALAEAKEKR